MNDTFDLQIMFKGLCLFHMEPHRIGSGVKQRVKVLLVNATEGRTAQDGETVLHEHEPKLEFETSDCVNVNELPSPDQDGEIDLSELTVKVGDTGEPTYVPRTPIPCGVVPGGSWGARSQFQWIASLSRLVRPQDPWPQLKAACLEKPLPRNEWVTSRVRLCRGMLECARLGETAGKEPLLWHFKEKANDPDSEAIWRQGLSDWVTLTVEGLEEPFPIELDREGSDKRILKLRGAPGETVSVVIRNTPVNSEHVDKKHLRHFRWFYELLEWYPEQVPVPSSEVAPCLPKYKEGPESTTNAFCPPASWGG